MIPNKFAYFSHGSTYRTNKEGENISDNSIAFVGDDQSIATQGKIFGVRGVYPGQEQENEDEGNTSTKIITTEPLFPLDANGKPLVGTTISVRFRYTNSYKTAGSNMCLNVNGTGAYNIYYNGSDYVSTTSANTTFCGYANREIIYTFRIDVVNNVEHPRWVFVSHGYESGNTNTIGYQLRHNSSTLPASDKFYRYRLLFTSADGSKYVPANTSSSTNATAARTVNQRPINPFGEILYYSSTTTISAGSNPAATVLWEEYTFNLGYSFNRTGAALTMSYPAPVYIKCTSQSDGSAIIDANTPYVQSLPSTNDGKIYIFLGIAYSATSVELMPTHPVYYHDGTGIRTWTGEAIDNPVYVVQLSVDANNQQITSDKTYDEILAATQANKEVIATVSTTVSENFQLAQSYRFSSYVSASGLNVLAFSALGTNLDANSISLLAVRKDNNNTVWSGNDIILPSGVEINGTYYDTDYVSGYINLSNALPTAATTDPIMDGTATIGSSNKYAKEDHVHPKDTTKQDRLPSFTTWMMDTFGIDILFGEDNFPRTEADAQVLTEQQVAALNDNANTNWSFMDLDNSAIKNYTLVQPTAQSSSIHSWSAITPTGIHTFSIKTHDTTDDTSWYEQSFKPFAYSTDLATVATSGSYNDLSDKPNIPTSADINAAKPLVVTMTYTQNGDNVTYGANETFATIKAAYLANREVFVVAPPDSQSGDGFTMRLMSYGNDITEILTFSSTVKLWGSIILLQATCDNFNNWGFSATQIPPVDSSITGADQTNPVQGGAIYTALENKANINDLADVATSGSYNDLSDKPNIPTILTVPVNSTSTPSGDNTAYMLGNGIQYADIIAVLDNGGEVILKYGNKIYCLSKRENDSLTFSSLQGDDDNYSSFDIDSASRVGYHSGTIITSETTLSKGTPTGSGNAVTDITVSGHQITLTKGETFLKTGDISAWAKASTKPTYTASEVGALPANTHIPVDPVNADWNATSGLAEILHKPPIVQSISVNGGTAISPTDGNVNLEGIVTGIYSGNQGLAPGNDGIITLPEKVIYGSLENGSFYSATYDIITQEWTLSETTTAGMIGKIYIDLYNTDPAMAYVWDGTRFSELSPSLSGFATESYVDDAIRALPTPMVFQGTIGTGGTSTTVPSNPTEGDTYKIISGGQSLTFSGITAGTIKVGDTVIYKNSTVGWVLIPSGDEPSGTVTSVGMTVPTGLKVSGSPITSSGTLAVTYDSGYSIPPTADQESWNNKANVVFIQRVGNNWREVTYSDISHDWIVIGNSAPTGNPKNIYIEVLGGDAYYYDQKFSSFVRIDEDPTTITNDLNATVSGTALDATQGKILKDMIDAKQNAIEIIDLT